MSVNFARLVTATNYREFLRLKFEELGRSRAGFSYAKFARKAGYASRSFPRDVVGGKKSLTLESSLAFAKALELRGDLRSLFLLLVQDGNSAKIEKLRNRLRAERTPSKEPPVDFIRNANWFEIYAALGTRDRGASLEEVVSRTELSRALCKSSLTEMALLGAIRFEEIEKRYLPIDDHLILKNQGHLSDFQSYFLRSVRDLRVRAESDLKTDSEYFRSSAFLVQTDRLPEFKRELDALLTRFIDRAEIAEGNRVAKLTVGMFL